MNLEVILFSRIGTLPISSIRKSEIFADIIESFWEYTVKGHSILNLVGSFQMFHSGGRLRVNWTHITKKSDLVFQINYICSGLFVFVKHEYSIR